VIATARRGEVHRYAAGCQGADHDVVFGEAGERVEVEVGLICINQAPARSPAEGDCWLDLGPAAGLYHVLAVPVWTSDEDVGPNGENAVGAMIEALDGRRRARNSGTRGPSMFE
jgi:hypothetical protein